MPLGVPLRVVISGDIGQFDKLGAVRLPCTHQHDDQRQADGDEYAAQDPCKRDTGECRDRKPEFDLAHRPQTPERTESIRELAATITTAPSAACGR